MESFNGTEDCTSSNATFPVANISTALAWRAAGGLVQLATILLGTVSKVGSSRKTGPTWMSDRSFWVLLIRLVLSFIQKPTRGLLQKIRKQGSWPYTTISSGAAALIGLTGGTEGQKPENHGTPLERLGRWEFFWVFGGRFWAIFQPVGVSEAFAFIGVAVAPMLWLESSINSIADKLCRCAGGFALLGDLRISLWLVESQSRLGWNIPKPRPRATFLLRIVYISFLRVGTCFGYFSSLDLCCSGNCHICHFFHDSFWSGQHRTTRMLFEESPTSGAGSYKPVVGFLHASCLQPPFHRRLHGGWACDVHPINSFFGPFGQAGDTRISSRVETASSCWPFLSHRRTADLLTKLLRTQQSLVDSWEALPFWSGRQSTEWEIAWFTCNQAAEQWRQFARGQVACWKSNWFESWLLACSCNTGAADISWHEVVCNPTLPESTRFGGEARIGWCGRCSKS